MTSTVPEGIRGNAGLLFTYDGNGYDGNVKAVRIKSSDKDDSDLTFLEAASGDTKDYQLAVTAIQSTAVGSLWRTLWENPGDEVPVVYGPHGNAVATADKPHFLMTVKANGRPEIGGEAKRSKDRGEFEYEFEVTAGPTLDDGTP